MSNYVCIDIGGTGIKYGLATEQGLFLKEGQVPTQVWEKGVSQIVTKVAQLTEIFRGEYKPEGLAVATAGIVDPHTGTILHGGINFPGYTGFKLKAELEKATGLPCTVENDVNAAGLGEYWQGDGRGVHNLCCLMIGTGIGGCLIIEGHLVSGASYSAGEVGYQRINDLGTWEETASTKALVKKVAQAKGWTEQQLNGREVLRLAKNGDPIAKAILGETIEAWAAGIANICYIVNPEKVILGGGITAEKAYLGPLLGQALQVRLIPWIYTHTQICFSRLGDRIGMLGALYNFLHNHDRAR